MYHLLYTIHLVSAEHLPLILCTVHNPPYARRTPPPTCVYCTPSTRHLPSTSTHLCVLYTIYVYQVLYLPHTSPLILYTVHHPPFTCRTPPHTGVYCTPGTCCRTPPCYCVHYTIHMVSAIHLPSAILLLCTVNHPQSTCRTPPPTVVYSTPYTR